MGGSRVHIGCRVFLADSLSTGTSVGAQKQFRGQKAEQNNHSLRPGLQWLKKQEL